MCPLSDCVYWWFVPFLVNVSAFSFFLLQLFNRVMPLGLLVCQADYLISFIHCSLFSSGRGYCPHIPPTLEWNVRISDEKPHIMQFLERGAPLERASAEEREGGGIHHQDNCIHVGLSSLKAMFDCRIAKVWQMEEDEGKRHKSTPEVWCQQPCRSSYEGTASSSSHFHWSWGQGVRGAPSSEEIEEEVDKVLQIISDLCYLSLAWTSVFLLCFRAVVFILPNVVIL